jgi:hypothetical protein
MYPKEMKQKCNAFAKRVYTFFIQSLLLGTLCFVISYFTGEIAVVYYAFRITAWICTFSCSVILGIFFLCHPNR